MSFLPCGRLFWKFLLFFFLAQMTAVIGTGLAIWATLPDPGNWPPPRIEGPPFPGASPEAAPPPPPPGGHGNPGMPPLPPPGNDLPLAHLLAGAVVSLIFAALLAAYIARPIRRLRLALQAGASGQLTPDLAAAMGSRSDELTDLCRDFDRMARHLDQLMEGQRHLLHDVSHEMRSPLARFSAIIGLIRQQPEKLDDYLSRMEHESNRMDRLVSELLTLSRLESGMVAAGGEATDLAEVLADVVSDAAPEAVHAGCRVELNATEGALVRGDPEMLHRVFDNLLRNALAYAASGGWVGIFLSPSDDEVLVSVEDAGPGVSSADLDRLFLPFFRGARTSGKNGHGLGLAIARRIVENYRGRIEAENRQEGGLRLTVVLPRFLPETDGEECTPPVRQSAGE